MSVESHTQQYKQASYSVQFQFKFLKKIFCGFSFQNLFTVRTLQSAIIIKNWCVHKTFQLSVRVVELAISSKMSAGAYLTALCIFNVWFF